MSLRHSVRERDVRLHDPHAPPPPPGPPVAAPPGATGPPPPPHAIHLNGNVAGAPPPPPPISNGHGHSHGAAIGHGAPMGLSPVAAPAGPPVPHANGGGPPPPPPPAPNSAAAVHPTLQKLARANEETWLLIGSVAEQMGDLDRALSAYERALLHNSNSLPGLTQVAGIARIRENYTKAIEYFQRVIQIQQDNGEVWSALGHCYLMIDDLQKAYSAYQQALYLLPNPKEDPKLWYGIGILYDRYGSLDHAEEAFASVLHMDKALDFDKANEILFRLGIIYKQQGKYTDSLDCFDRILRNPPNPLAHADIWFQIGHVYEQQKDYIRAKDAYERVVQENPAHAKVLQQLGWLYHQEGSTFQSQDLAITYLTKSLEADPSDAQSWYLLGRAYMAGQKYNKAYEAYQQAVYRDGRNPTFWCSIGVLYFQINQYRDALDAYSRAIRINPYISEVWYDLGSLYESCNNQISDAIDAYARAAELDPGNTVITQRLALLRQAQQSGQSVQTPAPLPQDVHPTAYASAVGPPVTMSGGPPMLLSSGPTPRPIFSRTEAREHPNENALPSPHASHAPPPFRGGPPPPVVLDDSRRVPPSIAPLAPMDVDRATPRDGFPPRESSRSRGPGGTPQNSLLLHHPSGQQVVPEHQRDPAYYGRQTQRRPVSPSVSPPPRQARGPPDSRDVGYHGYPSGPPPTNGSVGGRPPSQVLQRSPRPYQGHYDAASSPPPPPQDTWERERRLERDRSRPRRDSDRSGIPPNVQGFSQSRGPSSPMSAHPYDHHGHPPSRRTAMESPMMGRPPSPGHPLSRQVSISERSPVVGPGAQGPGMPRWQSSRYADESGRSPHAHAISPTMAHVPPPSGTPSRRYDPRFDEGSRMERVERIERLDRERYEREREYERRMTEDARERERMEARTHAGSPETHRSASVMSVGPSRSVLPPPPTSAASTSEYPVPYPPPNAAESSDRRRGRKTAKESDTMNVHGPPTPAPGSAGSSAGSQSSDKRKRRAGGRRGKDGSDSTAGSRAPSVQPGSFRVAPIPPNSGSIKSPPSPEPKSSASASGSSGRSSRPSPIGNAHAAGLPRREVDEDYDEGVAESLMSLATSGGSAPPPVSPTVSVGGRIRHVSPRSKHNKSAGLTSGHSSQLPGPGPLSVMTSQNGNGKRPLSPINTADSGESKRTRVDILNRPAGNRITTPPPQSSSRPSPIPFRTQPSRSPDDRAQPGDRDVRMRERSPSSATNTTGIPSTMPLPPPPSAVVSTQGPILPPIATLPVSPTSSGVPSPSLEQERMHVDVGRSRRSHSRSGSDSTTPPVAQSVSRTKISDVMNPTGSEASHTRRNSSTHSSPTNAHSQGNAMATRTSPKAKSTSPRS
ncbi:SSN6 [Sanghuangporus sanghuang]